MRGMGCCTTGWALREGSVEGSGGGAAGLAGGPSIDQVVAQHIGRETAFDSLQFGVYSLLGSGPGADGSAWAYSSYAAAEDPRLPEDNPVAMYERLFSMGNIDNSDELERVLAERRSVNDLVKSSFTALSTRVSSGDRVRLEEHLEKIREVERRLMVAPVSCDAPARPTIDFENPDNFEQILELQADLAVLALACGVTRVASIQCSRGASDLDYTWLGLGDHHGYQHADDNSEGAAAQAQICTWYAERFAAILDRMTEVVEADGSTLLQNSLVYWANDLGRGNTHSLDEVPIVLAGTAAGAITAGRFLSYQNEPHNKALASCARAMGIDTESFGDPEFSGTLF
jgi:hypothetical protein